MRAGRPATSFVLTVVTVVALLATGAVIETPALRAQTADLTAEQKQNLGVVFKWLVDEWVQGGTPFEKFADSLSAPREESDEDTSVPEVREEDWPDKTVIRQVEAKEYAPAGQQTETQGWRMFTSAQGQVATLDYNYRLALDAGAIRQSGGVDSSITSEICPSAAGTIKGKFRIEIKSALGSELLSVISATRFDGTFVATVGDDATIGSMDLAINFERTLSAGPEEQRVAGLATLKGRLSQSDGIDGKTFDWTAQNVEDRFKLERLSDASAQTEFNASFVIPMYATEAKILTVLLPKIQRMFRNNYCVEMQYRGLPAENIVAPLSVSPLTVAVRHRFENRDISSRAEHRLQGYGAFAPLRMASTPMQATYTAPPDLGPSASSYGQVFGRAISKRGIGRARLAFDLEPRDEKPKPPVVATPVPPPVAQETLTKGRMTFRAGFSHSDEHTTPNGDSDTKRNLSGEYVWTLAAGQVDVIDRQGGRIMYRLKGTSRESGRGKTASLERNFGTCGSGGRRVVGNSEAQSALALPESVKSYASIDVTVELSPAGRHYRIRVPFFEHIQGQGKAVNTNSCGNTAPRTLDIGGEAFVSHTLPRACQKFCV